MLLTVKAEHTLPGQVYVQCLTPLAHYGQSSSSFFSSWKMTALLSY